MKKFLILLFSVFFVVGCSGSKDNGLISYMDAKEKIINEGAILLDVRTSDEYNSYHIDGAVLLTLDTISDDSVKEVVTSKDSPVIVYCRTGNRSSQALIKLEELGYTNVYDLGSIDNWNE